VIAARLSVKSMTMTTANGALHPVGVVLTLVVKWLRQWCNFEIQAFQAKALKPK
jgi:hypothetical protein